VSTFYCNPHLCMSFFMISQKNMHSVISLNKNKRFLSHSVGVISQWILNYCGIGDSHLNPNHGRFSVTLIKVGIYFYQR
jgi:hypothetical protein